MISRQHEQDGTVSSADYSDCEIFRYALTREWDATKPGLLYIMLNPSKATEAHNDPTIERCERRARALGFGAFRAVNIFGLRATDPAELRKAADPNGPENDAALADALRWTDGKRAPGQTPAQTGKTLCAWGTHGQLMSRGPQVEAALRASGRPLHMLGLTRDGHPRHPLYVSYATRPALWPAS